MLWHLSLQLTAALDQQRCKPFDVSELLNKYCQPERKKAFY